MAAVTELSRLKDAGTSVQDAIAQVGMFGEYSAEVRDLLQFLADNIRRRGALPTSCAPTMLRWIRPATPTRLAPGRDAAPAKGDLMTAARQDAQGELLDGNPATRNPIRSRCSGRSRPCASWQ